MLFMTMYSETQWQQYAWQWLCIWQLHCCTNREAIQRLYIHQLTASIEEFEQCTASTSNVWWMQAHTGSNIIRQHMQRCNLQCHASDRVCIAMQRSMHGNVQNDQRPLQHASVKRQLRMHSNAQTATDHLAE